MLWWNPDSLAQMDFSLDVGSYILTNVHIERGNYWKMYAHLGKVKLLLEICQLKLNFHKFQRLTWKLLFRQADRVLAAVTGRYESLQIPDGWFCCQFRLFKGYYQISKTCVTILWGTTLDLRKQVAVTLLPPFPLGSQTEASSFRFGSHTLYPCWTLIHSGIRVSLQHSWSKRPKIFPDLARGGHLVTLFLLQVLTSSFWRVSLWYSDLPSN